MSIVLYKHNQETYNNIQRLFLKHQRVGVVQPTGTGKSFLFLKWIYDHPSDKFIILSPSNEIFVQLNEYVNETKQPNLLNNVDCITYQSLNLMPKTMLMSLKPNKLIIDEFHRVGAPQWELSIKKLLSLYPDIQILGTSATPVRYLDGARDMAKALFHNVLATEMTLGEVVSKNILPTPEYIPVFYDLNDKFDSYQKIINTLGHQKKTYQKKLDTLKRHLESSYGVQDIFKKRMRTNHGKYIVFCRDSNHIIEIKKVIYDWFKDINSNLHLYTSISAQKDKDIQLNAFKNDTSKDAMKLLFTVDRLNEGIHIKDIDGVIMLRPTVSPIIYLQQIGRALACNKKKPLIFDMVNNYQSVKIDDENGEAINVFEKEFKDAQIKENNKTSFNVFDKMIEFNLLVQSLENIIYINKDTLWKKNLNHYIHFKKLHGREPKKKEIYNDYPIGSWCRVQKNMYHKGTLSNERYELLISNGFIFENKLDYNWKKNFEVFKSYIENYHRFPTNRTIYHNVAIGKWCSRQKKAYLNGELSTTRYKLLLSHGFIFEDQCEMKWNKKYQLYLQFKKKHQREPNQREIYQNVLIGIWCHHQKQSYKKGILSTERINKLQKSGFIFTNNKNHIWNHKYELYKEYIKKFNKKPKNREIYKDVAIGKWQRNQIQLYKNNKLSNDRIKLLEEIGMI